LNREYPANNVTPERDRPLQLSGLARACFTSVYMTDIVRSEFLALFAPHFRDSSPVVLECENALVTREFVPRTDVVVVTRPELIRYELQVGALRELWVRQLLELGSLTPLRTEIGLVDPVTASLCLRALLLESLVGIASSGLATRTRNAPSSS